MARDNIIAFGMLGMNRLFQRDRRFAFDMARLERLDIRRRDIDEDDYNRSIMAYELFDAVDALVGEAPHRCYAYLGRGRWDMGEDDTSTTFHHHFLTACRKYGKDAFKVVVAKSFGATQAMEALLDLDADFADEIGRIDLVVLVDVTAPGSVLDDSLDRITVPIDELDIEDRTALEKLEAQVPARRRKDVAVKTPICVDRLINVAEREDGRLFAGRFSAPNGLTTIHNVLLTPESLRDIAPDGPLRFRGKQIQVNHKNIDEICCAREFGIMLGMTRKNLRTLIAEAYAHHIKQ